MGRMHKRSAIIQKAKVFAATLAKDYGERLCGYSYRRSHLLPAQAADKGLFAHTVEGRH